MFLVSKRWSPQILAACGRESGRGTLLKQTFPAKEAHEPSCQDSVHSDG